VTRLLRLLTVLALAAAPVVVPGPVAAAPGDPVPSASTGPEPVMLVVDTSGSMAEDDGTGVAKIDGARTAILDLFGALPADSYVGLRSYPSASGGCDPGDLTIAPRQKDTQRMDAAVRALTADGDTPTAEALAAAGDDLRAAGYTKATLVLVSDGLSTCEDPCPVAQQLAQQGLAVTVNTVGFRIDADGAEQLRCIARSTGGTYSDVTDSSALADTLATLNGAELDVSLSYPEKYSPQGATSASLDVVVEIENLSTIQADDVRASIVFDPGASGGSPTVLRPVRVLGNIAGGSTATVSWQAFPSTVRNSGTLDFGVTVTRAGGPPVVQTGTVELGGELNVAAGGALLQNARHVVVLGDSYSAGEGAGVGLPGHRYAEDAGACHRSDSTYAKQLFAATDVDVDNLACSGAVIGDHFNRQKNRDVDPQERQLAAQSNVDLIFLTMGGNDLNFSSIIKNCLLGDDDCTANPVTCLLEDIGDLAGGDLPICDKGAMSLPVLWQWELGHVRPRLQTYYEDVLRETADDGTSVVVLPYPDVLPDEGWAFGCQRGFPGLSDREIALIRWLEDTLNAKIADAVAAAQKTYPDRIYYADDVVHAVQPDHTLCGGERWINGILDNGAGGLVKSARQQELVHPNAKGYGAEAAALLRWSRTITPVTAGDVRDARPLRYRVGGAVVDAAGNVLESAVEGAQDLWHGVQQIDLRVPTIISVTPGLSYRVSAGGFAPGETVVVAVASSPEALATAIADEQGNVDTEVRVPDRLASGDHTLFATGFTPDGTMQLVGRPLDVGGPALAGPLTVLGGAALLLVAGALLVRYGRRRRRAAPTP
jgi:Mg-chelatase subunit ChlD/lysophospholipase L1-like esterase